MIRRFFSAIFGRLTIIQVRMQGNSIMIAPIMGRLTIQYFDDRTPNFGNSDVKNGSFFRLNEGEMLTLRLDFGQKQAENTKESTQ
jgi:hypothetical protein